MLLVWCEPLDGGDLRAIDKDGRHQTAGDGFTVHGDGACAAHAHAAPFLRAGQTDLIADEIDETAMRRHGGLALLAVELKANGVSTHNSPSERVLLSSAQRGSV